MGKPTGFMDYPQEMSTDRPVADRLKDYREVKTHLPLEIISTQGARCMDCGTPYCHAVGCPVYNLIPEWNDLVYRGEWREALERLELTNNLPEITGRLCPAPCETACTLAINDAPVTIKQIELAIVEYGFERGWIVPQLSLVETGKRVAVIGSGPAGLAAAQQLRRSGHRVTVYEKDSKPGGLLRYGVPDFKLEKWVIDRRLAVMEAEGIEFETDVFMGKDISAHYLSGRFDAIVLAVGAGAPRDLQVPGRGLEGIHFAMPYLTQSNKFVAGELSRDDILWAGDKRVLVIGGGDTGSDCVGTANRQGAKSVHQFEIMPRPLDWKEVWNPQWPDWPQIMRTSTSHQEGCEREWSILTKQFSGQGVQMDTAHFARVQWQPATRGKDPQMNEIAGSEFSLQVDLVLLATGFIHVEHGQLVRDLGLKLDNRGNVALNADYHSSVPGVFAVGDAAMGASLVVHAISHGRQVANAVDRYLRGKE